MRFCQKVRLKGYTNFVTLSLGSCEIFRQNVRLEERLQNFCVHLAECDVDAEIHFEVATAKVSSKWSIPASVHLSPAVERSN